MEDWAIFRSGTVAALLLVALVIAPLKVSAGVYKLKSMRRAQLAEKYGDCYWLRPKTTDIPISLSFNGHCCDDVNEGIMDFEFNKRSVGRSLQTAFQWKKNTDYYLAVNTTSQQLQLEKISGGLGPKHKFVMKSAPVGDGIASCIECVTLKSVANGLYLATTDTGAISMTTSRKMYSAFFKWEVCPYSLDICRLNIMKTCH
ncbi:uncharacterized protein LOC116614217 [Nematostella vectensis]|uniref:uncharacterized protein LOC116614217 n=1 Tax=Nematostella vectensis TaxID=45351 RepID=UPI0013900A2E|nr:uncharacterized protein LOC116614217 [Nematostella vectensis]